MPETVTQIVIPDTIEGVTVNGIDSYAFAECTSLESLTLPQTITIINRYAFRNCTGLKSINIPASVTSMGNCVFAGCEGLITAGPTGSGCNIEFGWAEIIPANAFEDAVYLTSITMPDSITAINLEAFRNCSALKKINIPGTVTSVNGTAFSGCSSLKTAGPIGSGCDYEFGWTESIPNSAFRGCVGLTSVTLPEGLTSISNYAFYNCTALSRINMPESITTIGTYAFGGCTGLTSIIMPEGLTSIGSYAFYNSGALAKVGIPTSVSSIGNYAFRNCNSLSSLVIRGNLTTIGENAFYGCSSLTTAGPIGSGCDYEFGWSEKIPRYAFDGCTGLTSVNIPKGVTAIGNYAFNDCDGLTSVNMPEGVTTIGTYAFSDCTALTSISIPEGATTIGPYAFGGCSNLTKVVIPGSVTSISSVSFKSCDKLITAGPIGSGCNYEFGWTDKIPSYAFSNCSSLTKITTALGNSAFYGCSGLTKIIVPGSVTTIDSNTFLGCSGLTTAGFTGSGCDYEFGWTESIPEYAFKGCSGLTRVTLPVTITTIGKYGFYECKSLESINIPADVTLIGEFAFNGCSSLKTMSLPKGITKINRYTYTYCSSMTSISIPEGVTDIVTHAFDGCSSLTEVVIPESVTEMGDSAFRNCAGLTKVVIPKGLTPSGGDIFSGCTGLTAAGPIGSGLNIEFGWCNELPQYAFYDCDGLETITIPYEIKSINTKAFSYADGIKTVYCYEGSVADNTALYTEGASLVYITDTVKISNNEGIYSFIGSRGGLTNDSTYAGAYFAQVGSSLSDGINSVDFYEDNYAHLSDTDTGADTALVLPIEEEGNIITIKGSFKLSDTCDNLAFGKIYGKSTEGATGEIAGIAISNGTYKLSAGGNLINTGVPVSANEDVNYSLVIDTVLNKAKLTIGEKT